MSYIPPYLYSTAMQIKMNFGIKHAAKYLADRNCPIETALFWLLTPYVASKSIYHENCGHR